MMFAFWGVLIVGLVLLVRWLKSASSHPTPPEESALDTLKRRYAAGELSEEEYEKMRSAVER